MQRILVIGCGGAGKSTLSRQIGERLQLPVLHLDAHYWQPGWIEPNREDWAQTVAALTARDAWVMDGNYSGTLPMRLAACDRVVFLDLPRWRCLWRVCRRSLTYRGRTRPDMAEGCPERLEWAFFKWIWQFPRQTRPRLEAMLAQVQGKQVIRLRSPGEVRGFLRELARLGDSA